MNAALLLIDVQESFRHRPYFTARDLPAYLQAQNALVQGCERAAIPIVRVFHVDADDGANNPFALESGYVRPMAGLVDIEPAAEFHKRRHSALIGSGLDVWLTQHGIGKLIVSGIRTEQCCETTTRHASDLGYAVDYVLEATLTFDMQHADGSMFTAAQIRQRTASVLERRFAQIRTVEQALEDLPKY